MRGDHVRDPHRDSLERQRRATSSPAARSEERSSASGTAARDRPPGQHVRHPYGRPGCGGEVHHLHGIRLGDGSTIVDVATPTALLPVAGALPLAIDARRGRSGRGDRRRRLGLAIVDPENGWRSLPVAEGDHRAVAVVPATVVRRQRSVLGDTYRRPDRERVVDRSPARTASCARPGPLDSHCQT
jgi:hypothetical protein